MFDEPIENLLKDNKYKDPSTFLLMKSPASQVYDQNY